MNNSNLVVAINTLRMLIEYFVVERKISRAIVQREIDIIFEQIEHNQQKPGWWA